MIKKFSLLAAAMAILAFAVPALASASTGLTEEGKLGTLVPVGSKVTGTSIGTPTLKTTRLGTTTCEKVVVNGEVTKDSATEGVEGIGIGEGTSSGCKRNGSIAVTVNAIKLTNIRSAASESGIGTASFSFTLLLPELTCNYSATNAPVTFTANTNRLKLNEAALTVSPASCGTSKLTTEFGLATTASPNTPILIM